MLGIGRRTVVALGSATALLLTACGATEPASTQAVGPNPAKPASAITAAATTAARSREAPPAAATLTPRQLAGQRIIYAYSGLTPPSELLGLIRRGEAAGVIFFAPNIASRTQLRAVTAELDRANLASPISAPLLFMVDQEGGLVRRLPGAPEYSEKQIGASVDGLALARAAGAGTAVNLSSAGLNVDLAPVLDVYRRSGNFIDGDERSYSSDAGRVATLGTAFIRAQQGGGVASTAKHFPGLGAAASSQNTDASPVTLSQGLRAIRAIDEVPYRTAIAGGVRLVMLSWATYPALDPTLPAGLSPTVVGKELRQRLGFDGVTITDSLDAGALRAFGGPAQRARLAVRAGDDLILCSGQDLSQNSPSIGKEALDGIASAIVAHEVSRPEAEQAAARVVALRTGI